MDTTGFEAALVKDGYKDIETKALRSDYRAREHSHPFDVRALVLAGEITLAWNGTARSFAAGDVFTMDAGCSHAEAAGPEGVRYLVGRRPR
jgi:quercetin dioxygenase-like cupin family protein